MCAKNCRGKKKGGGITDLMKEVWNTIRSFADVNVLFSEAIPNVFPINV